MPRLAFGALRFVSRKRTTAASGRRKTPPLVLRVWEERPSVFRLEPTQEEEWGFALDHMPLRSGRTSGTEPK